MVFDQTIYVCNASSTKVYVRTTYEKWQQLKFSTEVKLISGTSTGGGIDFQQASNFTEGFTALAPHHTLKMIGSFFSAEVEPATADGAAAGAAGPVEIQRVSISRNYRVPNHHAVIITPDQTLQAVRSGDKWRKHCKEFSRCPFMFREKKDTSCWQRLRKGQQEQTTSPPCDVCKRDGRAAGNP